MFQCQAWVGPCSTEVPVLIPGLAPGFTDSVDLLRALTRVLWRELLAQGRIRITVEWDQDPGLQNVSILTPDGDLLLHHTLQASEGSELRPDVWPEIEYQTAEPPAYWLSYLVDGWLYVGDDELLDAGSEFPGVNVKEWDALDDNAALEVARSALGRLERAIQSSDIAELKAWAESVPINDGWFSEAVVSTWSDQMTWERLSAEEKQGVRALLDNLRDTGAADGCHGLLILADLADTPVAGTGH